MSGTRRGGVSLRRLLVGSVAILGLIGSQAEAASVACFAPADAKEAHLREMQQEFTVAALSCGPVQAQNETMADRYNAFVGKFATALRDNARTLLVHFSHHGGSPGFDAWMTKLANSASERAATDPDYCMRAWGSLQLALLVAPNDIADFATTNASAGPSELVPVCHERRADKSKGLVGMIDSQKKAVAQ
jgi:hypothetical protein